MKKILLISLIASILLMGSVMAETITVVSDADEQVYGPLDHYAGISSSDWGTSVPAVLTWIHPDWPAIEGADWISNTYYIENTTVDSWRLFEEVIEINPCATNLSGNVIMVTGDNTEEAYLNGVLIGSDGETQGAFVDNHEWDTVLSYNLTGLHPGTNTLQFIVRNYELEGSNSESNPTGLLYKTDITYDIDPECETPIIPEFGTVIGILTMVSAIGIFLFVRRK